MHGQITDDYVISIPSQTFSLLPSAIPLSLFCFNCAHFHNTPAEKSIEGWQSEPKRSPESRLFLKCPRSTRPRGTGKEEEDGEEVRGQSQLR